MSTTKKKMKGKIPSKNGFSQYKTDRLALLPTKKDSTNRIKERSLTNNWTKGPGI